MKDDRLISLNAAIDALNMADDKGQIHSILDVIDVIKAQPSATDTNVRSRATEADDLINRKDTIKAIEAEKVAHGDYTTSSYVGYEFAEEVVESMPSAQQDTVTASLEELINDYGEDGFFIVDGVNYKANELLNELKTNSSVGEKFRKQITKTIVQYFMKFGG